MTWANLTQWFAAAAHQIATFGANWLLQTTLIVAAGLLCARLLKRHGAAVQSGILRATCLAIFVCPLVSWSLGSVGVTGFRFQLPSTGSVAESPARTRTGLPSTTTVTEPESAVTPGLTSSLQTEVLPDSTDDRFSKSQPRETNPVVGSLLPADDVSFAIAPARSDASQPLVAEPIDSMSFWYATAALVWLTACLLLLGRLLVAYWIMNAARRRAREAPDATIELCHKLAGHLGVEAPGVLISRAIHSPCLFGCRRPTILLPAADDDAGTRDVMIHELAHLRRGDCYWQMLCSLSCAVLWCQPLVWWLARRMQQAADDVCDDFVVSFGRDRHDYARQLVALAERFQPHWPAAGTGCGVFVFKSSLAGRIQRIIDPARSLSTRIGLCTLVAILMMATCGTLTIGILGAHRSSSAFETGWQPRPSDDHEPQPADNGNVEAAAGEQPARLISGQVTGVDGKPAVNARVSMIASSTVNRRGGDLLSPWQVLSETTTDAQGRFEIRLQGVSPKSYQYPSVIARTDQSALAWQRLKIEQDDADVQLQLSAEQPIRGRLVDIEGQPAAGVVVQLRSIIKVAGNPGEPDGVGFGDMAVLPKAWPEDMTTDDDGRFTLRHVPDGYGVFLNVQGNDRFAEQSIALNTGMAEERGERDQTYRPLVRNVEPGVEALFPLAPAQIVEGTVVFDDTGQPAANARLTVWASQQEFGGSMTSVAGRTNANGKFRISPKSGVRFGLNAYPPDNTPYLIHNVDDFVRRGSSPIDPIEVRLPRGVIVRGTVVEKGTGKPVPGASIQYQPESVNNPNDNDRIVTGWQGIVRSDEQGKYQIVVLPGPGHLLVHGPSDSAGGFVLQQMGSRQLNLGKPGGARIYSHAFHRLDPAAGSEPFEATIELEPGQSVVGHITDPEGNPTEAIVVSGIMIHPTSIYWRPLHQEIPSSRFELSGLAANVDYPLHVLDPKRKLGATVMVSARNPRPIVTLEPCGQARARIINDQGKPMPGRQVTLEMVVNEGPHKYDLDALRGGQLLADSDFAANIDRLNYWRGPEPDAEGWVTLPALIPGGRYRIYEIQDGEASILADFVAVSGETLELGELVMRELE